MNLIKYEPNDSGFTENVLSAVNIAVILIDLDGTIYFANRAVKKTLGFLSEELVGEKLSILLTPEDHDIFYQNLLSLGVSKNLFEGELMLFMEKHIKISI